ncbi:unnamed protein product [Caenorhabditis auriculariae]|uniref:Uncharacterized protein n=1 Tax=Caenorhabditis auriculariae TaxID=2777116 RepID=A0A8S1HFG9_9PELO|nr:unnamed protein product [Caenorhabditis auriculariae]
MKTAPRKTTNGRIRIRDLPRKFLPYLHPSLRTIVLRTRRRYTVNRTLTTRIKNRYFNYTPKPRVFPWYCETCTLSSRFFSSIIYHECRKKNASLHVQDFTNEQRIAQLGHRSKARDALAVMERIPNPQHVELTNLTYKKPSTRKQAVLKVPSLADLCTAKLAFPEPNDGFPMKEVFTAETTTFKDNDCGEHVPTGYLCCACNFLFENFSRYDEHVAFSSCTALPEPMQIDMKDALEIGDVEHRRLRHRPVRRVVSHLKCTSCGAGGFESPASLYDHVIKCAVASFQSKKLASA